MSDLIPAILYAALSKKDEDDGEDSIQSQIREIRERLEQIGGRIEAAEPFTDHGYSGSKRNRGPDLERAIRAAVDAAEEHGQAELWAVVSSRFGRGSGRLNEARAVGALFYELRAKGVALRTVHDDEFVTNEMLIGFASRQASKYSEDLSASVKRSKRRQAEAGQHLGGPPPLGFVLLDGALVPDPGHVATAQRVFELARQGMPDDTLARSVNAEGHRTKANRPFDRRAIQGMVRNPTYAGLIVHEGVEYEANWAPIVDPKTWRAIQAARAKRDPCAGRHEKGRPARQHLLSKLARCGVHGEPMFATTSAYVRKDGSRARHYECRGGNGICEIRVDAVVVDTAVLENLSGVMPRFDQWIAQLEDRHAAERQRLEAEVERARGDHDHQARKLAAAERKWSEYLVTDEAKAEVVLPMVERQRQTLEQAVARLRAAEDALATVPAEVEHDRLLDVAVNLRAEIAGRIEGGHSVEHLNRTLKETFSAFTICTEIPEELVREGVTAADGRDALSAGAVYACPIMRREVFWRLMAEDEGETPPPMEWIEALDKSANSS